MLGGEYFCKNIMYEEMQCWKTMIALQDTVDTTVHFNIETHTIVIKGTK